MDRVVRGGTVVTPGGRFLADVGIEGGRISAVAAPGTLRADDVLDVTGLHVLPGVIDPHVHFRDPGHTHKEDAASGSAAAAAGGVTMYFDMPSTTPPVTTAQRFDEKRELFTGRSWTDFGLWGMAFEDNYEHFADMAAAGAVGIKAFMAVSSSGRPPLDDTQLLHTFRSAAAAGLLVGVHAENHGVITLLMNQLKAQGRNDLLAHGESRPDYAETEAVWRAINLANAAGCRLHIVHLSTAGGLEAIRYARARGHAVTCETGPQYLYLTQQAVTTLGAMAVTNPPLRTEHDNRDLLQGCADGGVDCIATDHAPHSVADKTRPTVWEVPGGSIGVETSLPLLLTKVNEGHLSLERLTALMSENVARIFGLYPRKGAIQVGSDADLTIIDLNKEMEIRGEQLHNKSRVGVFEGVRCKGWPVCTVIGGNVVMQDGKLLGEPRGRFVPGALARTNA